MAYTLRQPTGVYHEDRRKKAAMTFKRCSLCGKEWPTREDFLRDKDVRLEGYKWDRVQVMAGLPSEGMLVFTHSPSVCGTSIAISASLFKRDQQLESHDRCS